MRLRMDVAGFKRLESKLSAAPQGVAPAAAETPTDDAGVCAPAKSRLEVLSTSAQELVVRPYGVGDACTYKAFVTLGKVEDDRMYVVERANLAEGSFRRSGFVHGVLFVPFKRRFSDRVLSGEGNLGYFVGYEVTEWRGWSLIPIASMGISLVNVDDNNADTSAAQRSDTGVRAAFTKSIGLVLKSFDSFQIGFILGHDRIGGDTTWKYENKPWMSVSIGFPFTQ
ncbi:hypothetical protein [Aquabacterium sp.]|uniref:hypothetical protein n=1 Tax=Aquabacterium sp. TaxID=1872578 RepID=UPI0025C4F411|nr:hypothetical protein [Aquabacterium sp.]